MARKRGYIEVLPSGDSYGILRVVAANGNVIVTSQRYASMSNARRAARWLRELADGQIEIRDATGKVLVEAE